MEEGGAGRKRVPGEETLLAIEVPFFFFITLKPRVE